MIEPVGEMKHDFAFAICNSFEEAKNWWIYQSFQSQEFVKDNMSIDFSIVKEKP